MGLLALDHVNVRTGRLEEMTRWYDEVLGMKAGPRPDFPFPGAWLYMGDAAAVHLVGVDSAPESRDPGIEHFAIRAEGLEEFMTRLADLGVAHELAEVPDVGILQVNVRDPDGNHIHVDFDLTERRAEGP